MANALYIRIPARPDISLEEIEARARAAAAENNVHGDVIYKGSSASSAEVTFHEFEVQPATEPEDTAAYIEIIERDRTTNDTADGSVIIPNQVRINGIPLLIPYGEQIKVHEMAFNDGKGDELTCVTLTLFARRVIIAAEGDL